MLNRCDSALVESAPAGQPAPNRGDQVLHSAHDRPVDAHVLEHPCDASWSKHPPKFRKSKRWRRNRAKPKTDNDGIECTIAKRKILGVRSNQNYFSAGTPGTVASSLEHTEVGLGGHHGRSAPIMRKVQTCSGSYFEHATFGGTHDITPPLGEAPALGVLHHAIVKRWKCAADRFQMRARRSDTAFSATMIDETDISKADTSGRSDHPSE